MGNDNWTKFVTELQECVAGRRGWVSLAIKRAGDLDVAYANLTVAATSLGLHVSKHGRYGWIASRRAAA